VFYLFLQIKLLHLCHHHFVSIKKLPKSLLKQRIPVDICIDEKQIADNLTASVNKNAFLRVATERYMGNAI